MGARSMKKTRTEQAVTTQEEMLPEYDLRKKGVRGKYYRAYRQGHTVRVRQEDGSVTVQHFPEDRAVEGERQTRQT